MRTNVQQKWLLFSPSSFQTRDWYQVDLQLHATQKMNSE